jgi:hypothetical protein
MPQEVSLLPNRREGGEQFSVQRGDSKQRRIVLIYYPSSAKGRKKKHAMAKQCLPAERLLHPFIIRTL